MKKIAFLAALVAALAFAPQTQAQDAPQNDGQTVNADGGDGGGAGLLGGRRVKVQNNFFFNGGGAGFRSNAFFFGGRRTGFVGAAFFIPAPLVVVSPPVLVGTNYGGFVPASASYLSSSSFSAGFSAGCGH